MEEKELEGSVVNSVSVDRRKIVIVLVSLLVMSAVIFAIMQFNKPKVTEDYLPVPTVISETTPTVIDTALVTPSVSVTVTPTVTDPVFTEVGMYKQSVIKANQKVGCFSNLRDNVIYYGQSQSGNGAEIKANDTVLFVTSPKIRSTIKAYGEKNNISWLSAPGEIDMVGFVQKVTGGLYPLYNVTEESLPTTTLTFESIGLVGCVPLVTLPFEASAATLNNLVFARDGKTVYFVANNEILDATSNKYVLDKMYLYKATINKDTNKVSSQKLVATFEASGDYGELQLVEEFTPGYVMAYVLKQGFFVVSSWKTEASGTVIINTSTGASELLMGTKSVFYNTTLKQYRYQTVNDDSTMSPYITKQLP
jgi:hypothetical protein